MKDAPRLKGGRAVRTASLFLGLVVMAVAIVALLQSGLGLAPWDVFHQGVARHSPLEIGTASIAVGLVVMCIAWVLGQPPGFGTVANAIVIGAVVDLLLTIAWVDRLSTAGIVARFGLLVLGVVLFGLGTACYIGAGLGAGPRDSMMLVLSRRTGMRIAVVRSSIELLAIGAGWALGGVVGLGTVAVALLLGPSVEGSFWLFARMGLAEPAPTAAQNVAP